jgi:hypothetical protein
VGWPRAESLVNIDAAEVNSDAVNVQGLYVSARARGFPQMVERMPDGDRPAPPLSEGRFDDVESLTQTPLP